MASRKTKLEVIIDGSAAGAKRAISGTRKAAGGLVSWMSSKFVITMGDVINATRAAWDEFNQALDLGARTKALQAQLADQGQTFDEFIGKLKEASKNAISEADLIETSTRTLLLGIPAEEISTLLELASANAVAAGRDIGDAFNDITTGLARGSPLILDNIGIVLDAKLANEQYAAAIGKSAEELTKAERVQALTAQIQVAGAKNVELLGDAYSGARLSVDQATAALTDAKDATIQSIVTNKTFIGIVTSVAKGIQNLTSGTGTYSAQIAALVKAYKPLLDQTFEYLQNIGRLATALGKVLVPIITNFVIPILDKLLRLVTATTGAIATVAETVVDWGEQLGVATGLIDKTATKTKELGTETAKTKDKLVEAKTAEEGMGRAVDATTTDIEDQTEALGKNSDAVQQLTLDTSALGQETSIELRAAIESQIVVLEQAREVLGANSAEYQRMLDIAEPALFALEDRARALEDGLQGVKEATVETSGSMENYTNQMNQGAIQTRDMANAQYALADSIDVAGEAARRSPLDSLGRPQGRSSSVDPDDVNDTTAGFIDWEATPALFGKTPSEFVEGLNALPTTTGTANDPSQLFGFVGSPGQIDVGFP